MAKLYNVQGSQFWKERIAKENSRMDAIEEARALAHEGRRDGQLGTYDDRSDAFSEVRSVAASESRSEARRSTTQSERSRGSLGGGRQSVSGRGSENKIEELEYRLQQEKIARLETENELEALRRASLEKAIADVKAGVAPASKTGH